MAENLQIVLTFILSHMAGNIYTSESPSTKRSGTEQLLHLIDGGSMDLGNPNSGLINIHFEIVNNRKSKSSTSRIQPNNQCYKSEIQNRFDPISITNDNDDTFASSKPHHIPPIFLRNSNKYQALVADLNKVPKQDYCSEDKGNPIKMNVSTSDDFRALTFVIISFALLKTRVCLSSCGTYLSLTDEGVTTELKSKHYPFLEVTRLYSKRKYPMPLVPSNFNIIIPEMKYLVLIPI